MRADRQRLIDSLDEAYRRAPPRNGVVRHVLAMLLALTVFLAISAVMFVFMLGVNLLNALVIQPIKHIWLTLDSLVISAWHYKRLWEKK